MNIKVVGLVLVLGISLSGCSGASAKPMGGKCPEIRIALSSSDLVVDNLQTSLNEGDYELSELAIETLYGSYELLYLLTDSVGGDEAFKPIDEVMGDISGILDGQKNSDFVKTRDSTWDYHESSKRLTTICEE